MTSVIFDIANVIVDWDPRRTLPGALPQPEVDEFFASAAFWELNELWDHGMPVAEAIAEMDRRAPHLGGAFRLYVDRYAHSVTGLVPGTTEVIRDLLAAGVACFGLSNWPRETFGIALAAGPVIDELADVIVSGEVGLTKPDPEIYRLGLRRFGLTAASTVFVDDRQNNVDASIEVGMTGLLFTDAGRLRRDLAGLGLL
ncbi:MAG: HAD family phosphatase [Micropruina sp.]|nr:HAD family phosphatase [Micropruina sp.]